MAICATGGRACRATTHRRGPDPLALNDAASRFAHADHTVDPHGPITFAYDPPDRLRAETTRLGTVIYAYDAAGRRTSMAMAGQAPATRPYDPNARLLA